MSNTYFNRLKFVSINNRQNAKMLFSGFLFVAINVAATVAAAQTCVSYIPDETPDSRYTIDAGNGTVIDTQTGLMWQRCSVGQTADASCSGTATRTNWQGALQAAEQANIDSLGGYTDWRLTNIKELSSLVSLQCVSPSINSSVFPNTVSGGYWTSSPYASTSGSAWFVHFGYGFAIDGSRDNGVQLRLVR